MRLHKSGTQISRHVQWDWLVSKTSGLLDWPFIINIIPSTPSVWQLMLQARSPVKQGEKLADWEGDWLWQCEWGDDTLIVSFWKAQPLFKCWGSPNLYHLPFSLPEWSLCRSISICSRMALSISISFKLSLPILICSVNMTLIRIWRAEEKFPNLPSESTLQSYTPENLLSVNGKHASAERWNLAYTAREVSIFSPMQCSSHICLSSEAFLHY